MKIIIVLTGCFRTFEYCQHSLYENFIYPFCGDCKPDILFYLKSFDPGAKGQKNRNYDYKQYTKDEINVIVNKKEYNKFILIDKEDYTEEEMYQQLKNRNMYKGFLDTHIDNEDLKYPSKKHIIRGMYQHYNMEKCGNYIQKIEKEKNYKYDLIVYMRPDIFFIKKCPHYSSFNLNLINVPLYRKNTACIDYFSFMPRKYLKEFFFDRMNFWRTNNDIIVNTCEEIYLHTIKNFFIKYDLCIYSILRENKGVSWDITINDIKGGKF